VPHRAYLRVAGSIATELKYDDDRRERPALITP